MMVRTAPDDSGPDRRDEGTSEPQADGDSRRLTGRRHVFAAVAGIATAVAAAFLPTADPEPPTLAGEPVATDDAHPAAMDSHLVTGASGGGTSTVPRGLSDGPDGSVERATVED